jgi:hypothetical protein
MLHSKVLRCRRTEASYEKVRTSPSAHILSRLTLNNGMIGMGANRNRPIAPAGRVGKRPTSSQE